MSQPAKSRSSERRVAANVARGCVGNLIEWYDWFAYAAFSVFFAHAFFPSESTTAQLLSTAVVFAVGFFVRPLGGYILGRFADRHGRRNALTLSVFMMAAGSLLIAVTPSFDSIGLFAPVLLVVARLIQGLSVGGEFASSATYLSEVATPGKRGFYSSFQYVSIILGQLSALFVQIVLLQILSREQMYEWGWRIPFVIGAVAAVVVMIIRRGMEESEHFVREAARAAALSNAAGSKPKAGTLATLLKYPRSLILVFSLTVGGTIAFYTYTTYMQKYMINTAGIDPKTVAWINFGALFVFMCLHPFVGALSDRIGRRPILIFFGASVALCTPILMNIIGHTTNAWAAFFLMLFGLTLLTGHTALAAIVKAELFPTKIRALGVGLPHAIVSAVFGGSAEPLALALKQAGIESVYFYYVSACALVTMTAAIFLNKGGATPVLDDVEDGGEPEVGANSVKQLRVSDEVRESQGTSTRVTSRE
ncbi:alpha-ketoglutarate transporter [Rhodococcus sp. 06-621-2]|nr:MFS transporter [Rhodococcus sp. 06-621-2]OZC55545.1 alpha-ketoglutarate transporter [Rhodococcus sp. 06-621-2]